MPSFLIRNNLIPPILFFLVAEIASLRSPKCHTGAFRVGLECSRRMSLAVDAGPHRGVPGAMKRISP